MKLFLLVVVCYELWFVTGFKAANIESSHSTGKPKKKPIFASYEAYIDDLSDESGFMTGIEAMMLHEADEVFSVPSSPTTASLLDTYGIDDTPPSQRKYNTFVPPSPPIAEVIYDFWAEYYLVLVGVTSLAIAFALLFSYCILHYLYHSTVQSPPPFLASKSQDMETLLSSLEKSSIQSHFVFHSSSLHSYLKNINAAWDSALSSPSSSITDLFSFCDRVQSLRRSLSIEVNTESCDIDTTLFLHVNRCIPRTMDEQLVHAKWAAGIHYTIAERLAECAARDHTTIEQLHAITAKCSQMNDLHIPIDGAALSNYRKCDLYLKKVGVLLCGSEAYHTCCRKIATHYSQRINDRMAALQSPRAAFLQGGDASMRVSYPIRYDVRQDVVAAVSQLPRVDVAGAVAEEERQAARDARRSADEMLRQWRNEHVEHVRESSASGGPDDIKLKELQAKRKLLKSRQAWWLSPYFALLGFSSVCIMHVHSSCFGRYAVNPFSDPGQWFLLQMSYFCIYVNASCEIAAPESQSIATMVTSSLQSTLISRFLWEAFSSLCGMVSLNAGAMYGTFLPCVYNIVGLLFLQLTLRWFTRKCGIQNPCSDSFFLLWSAYSLREPIVEYFRNSFPSTTPILILIVFYYLLSNFDHTYLSWAVYIPPTVKTESFSLKYMKCFSGIHIRNFVLYVLLPLLCVGWTCIVTHFYPLQCL